MCAGEVVGTGSTREQLVFSSLTTNGICSRRERSGSVFFFNFFISRRKIPKLFFFFSYIYIYIIFYYYYYCNEVDVPESKVRTGKCFLIFFFSPPVFNEHLTEKTL